MSFVRAPWEERLRLTQEQMAAAHERADRLETEARGIGNLRGLTFVLFLFSLGSAFTSSAPVVRTLSWVCALALVGLFLALITVHDRRLDQEAEARRLALVHGYRVLRLTGKSVQLPDTGKDLLEASHPFASDLDLFGPGSLFQHVSTAHTDFGRRLLARWLTDSTPPERAELRQGAVAELAESSSFRDELQQNALGLLKRPKARNLNLEATPDPTLLLAWIEAPAKLLTKPFYRIGRLLVPLCTIAGGVGAFSFGASNAFWILPLLVALGLLVRTSRDCTGAFSAVSHSDGTFLPYSTLLKQLEELEVRSAYLKELKLGLTNSGHPSPSAAMHRFRNIVYWYEIRHNGMLYPFLDALLLWSLNCTFELEKWKTDLGPAVRRWFEVIAEFEALSSFSNLLADDDHANLPELCVGAGELKATDLGHPLIAASKRVKNDVPPLRPGQALLVTGSNMSGKSTFLRALGVNAVLGRAGGPVIAETMVLPKVRLGTSLRVSDSLLDQTSHFLAEVKKLASVVDTAKRGEPVLFLLDEVLHGTNSRERQIGARWLLAELLDQQAFGILTTHDEGLCALEGKLAQSVRLYHFRENVTDEHMTFDYRLRPGPVTSGNALRVMRAVGLSVPLDPSE